MKPLSSSLRTMLRSTISSSLILADARVAAQHQALNATSQMVPVVPNVQWFGRLTMTGSIFRSS
jgi:hypothetical protein